MPLRPRIRQADRFAVRRHEEHRRPPRRLDHRRAIPAALRRQDAMGASRHRRHRDGCTNVFFFFFFLFLLCASRIAAHLKTPHRRGDFRYHFEDARRGDSGCQSGWLAGHCFQQRHAAEQALHQQWQRHFYREGRGLGNRVRERRDCARGHGRGCGGLRSQRVSEFADHEFLESDGGALSRREEWAFCG